MDSFIQLYFWWLAFIFYFVWDVWQQYHPFNWLMHIISDQALCILFLPLFWLIRFFNRFISIGLEYTLDIYLILTSIWYWLLYVFANSCIKYVDAYNIWNPRFTKFVFPSTSHYIFCSLPSIFFMLWISLKMYAKTQWIHHSRIFITLITFISPFLNGSTLW